ncbi:conserved hypothetical protein [Perkinsus marinus ATCC 50983]|uniref:DUF6451 domain-containing protein n=1 Tax=Perkinsus marinus (strain ATCC 50983 / TXsc) TaxID=423536 RepID=C5LA62_PERM5|nr:conserved hypothetical protein [Perkinsus marinus ATCC 50983]EER06318.1 conserved hypothetical protein [Perkinsus marinus ATCC 50983]|eukprot:XP_002774502.1 conserved hypothetical protein [Perkinsus marinus ATCC 50983]
MLSVAGSGWLILAFVTIERQRALRKSRMVGKYRRGVVEEEVEEVCIQLVEGQKLKCVGSMVYLGTLLTTKMKLTREINRRIGRAVAVFNDLKNIWKARGILAMTKKRIFKSCVMSVLLYNCETWVYVKNDAERLQRCCNKLVSNIIRWGRNTNQSNNGDVDGEFDWKVGEAEILDWLEGSTVKEIMNQRRLRWFGHALRQPRDAVQREWIESEIESDSKSFRIPAENAAR